MEMLSENAVSIEIFTVLINVRYGVLSTIHFFFLMAFPKNDQLVL